MVFTFVYKSKSHFYYKNLVFPKITKIKQIAYQENHRRPPRWPFISMRRQHCQKVAHTEKKGWALFLINKRIYWLELKLNKLKRKIWVKNTRENYMQKPYSCKARRLVKYKKHDNKKHGKYNPKNYKKLIIISLHTNTHSLKNSIQKKLTQISSKKSVKSQRQFFLN